MITIVLTKIRSTWVSGGPQMEAMDESEVDLHQYPDGKIQDIMEFRNKLKEYLDLTGELEDWTIAYISQKNPTMYLFALPGGLEAAKAPNTSTIAINTTGTNYITPDTSNNFTTSGTSYTIKGS